MKNAILIAALAFAACSPAPAMPKAENPPPVPAPAAKLDESIPLTPQGWGPLTIGMTKADVIAAAGDTKHPDAAGIPGSDCTEFEPARAPDGLFVMLEGDKLTSITIVDMSKIKTADGIGLGDAADKVKAQVGDLGQATPHKYQDAPAEYITVWEGGKRTGEYVQDPAARGVVFEIDGTGKVGAIHTGGPSIQYVEGCA